MLDVTYLRLILLAAAIGIPAAGGGLHETVLLVGPSGLQTMPAAVLAAAAARVLMAIIDPRPAEQSASSQPAAKSAP